MKSFFFVPASKLHKLSEIESLKPDNIIIDFEDSINKDLKHQYLSQVSSLNNHLSYWYRIPITNNAGEINLEFLNEFISLEIKHFILPKVENLEVLIHLDKNLKSKEVKTIILIEHAQIYIELKEVLTYDFENIEIVGLGLGAHDLVSEIGIPFSLEGIKNFRENILIHSKAYQILPIDIASMNIGYKDEFIHESQQGKEMGYEAKFIIHPKQLKWFREATLATNYEIAYAQKVIQNLPPNKKLHEIEPFVLDGEIIERMHIISALKTLNIEL